jgi:hypothetical protein
MKNSILLVGFLLAVSSCSKDTYDYPVRLISRDCIIVSEVALFTTDGQISDTAVINNYIRKNNLVFYSKTGTHAPLIRVDTIEYESKDAVQFLGQGFWGKRVPKQVGAYIYFYMQDTIAGYKTIFQTSVFKDIVNNIGIWKPYYKDLPPSAGGDLQYVFDAYIAKGNPYRLEFPEITYRITRDIYGIKADMTYSNYNNIFDRSVTEFLLEGDTMAIQEAKIIYVKTDQ